jgi:ribonucleoside-diphosphate reductase alpha chain
VRARELWDEIVENAWETGEPGVLFLDTINVDNPTPHLGRIEACNPCGEADLLPYEACVLGSINLSKFVTPDKVVNYTALEKAVFLAVNFLDNVIDVSKFPLPEIEEITKANRKVGLGIMGWADMLYQLDIPYDSDRALTLASQVMSFINSKAIIASEKLAEKKGAFPNFSKSIYKDDRPRRNAVVTSIAPTGTLASIAGTTHGIEPEYALVYTRTILDGKKFTVINSVFEEELKKRGLYSELLIEKIKAKKGSIQNMKELPQDIREVFKVAHDIVPEYHVRMQAAFQEHTEQSISKTINLPENATMQDVANAYMLAWESGCKGVTVYRDSARPQQVLSTKYIPQERPEILDGRTHKFKTGCGSLYVTVNRDLAGDVHEVFTAHSKNSGCVAALLNALARVTSIALRSGVAPEAIAKTMLGQNCGKCENIASCADAVGLALQKERQAEAEINQVETEVCEIGGGCRTCS